VKIQLERKLISCPAQLICIVCQQYFAVNRIRSLLYDDKGLLQGDICPKCLKLTANGIKQKILSSANFLNDQPNSSNFQTISSQELALELVECASEDVRFPSFYQWLFKRIEIFSQESQEIEAARFGITNYRCGKRTKIFKHWH
jgi:hypothetical protein